MVLEKGMVFEFEDTFIQIDWIKPERLKATQTTINCVMTTEFMINKEDFIRHYLHGRTYKLNLKRTLENYVNTNL